MTLHRLLFVFVMLAMSSLQPTAGRGLTLPIHSPTQAGGPEWQRYRVDGEEFSVLLPVVPAMTTSSTYIDQNRSRRERILGAYSDGVVYAIYTFEKKSLSLDELIRRFNPGQQTEPVLVDGIAGKTSRYEYSDRITITEFFGTAKNFYMFEAVGSKLRNPAAGISKFVFSIRFSKIPQGRTVVDGAGEPTTPDLGTTQNNVFSGKQVTVKVKVVTKPEPRYTEEARRNQVTGTVVLRAVFSSSGAVTNIHAMSGLPDGLTERAIQAARQIRFLPAIKDEQFVSMWIQLEYNFNL